MAIRRVDPAATFKIISQYDDALEHETPEELEALKTGVKLKTGLKDAEGAEIEVDEMKPTRYEAYLDELDESKLKFKEGEKPTHFIVRCLKNSEVAEINERQLLVDPVSKTTSYKNRNAYFMEHFTKGCLGVLDGEKTVKVNADDLGYGVAVAMGSVISLFTSLGKHLKKS